MTHPFSLHPLLATTLGLLLAALPATAELTVATLRCEYKVNPLGIDSLKPRLSWVLESAQRAQAQSAYQVLVASSDEKLNNNEADLWDSGKVASDQSAQIVYAGKPLASGQRACWKVRVWDKGGKPSDSPPASWEMGLLDQPDWKGKWITLLAGDNKPTFDGAAWIWLNPANRPEKSPAEQRYVRKSITLPENAKVKKALALVTADDQFVLFINGKETARSTGQRDAWKEPRLVDIAQHLVAGNNVIAIEATDTGVAAGILAKIVIDLGDSKPITIVTDKTWKASQPKEEGWQAPAFNDAKWASAHEIGKYGATPWNQISGIGTPPMTRYLRKPFAAAKAVKQARLYATAQGVYEIHLNGQRVGDYVFAPGWQDYQKRIPYQVYDVTGLVQQGDNTLAAILGDGWYCGFVGLGGRNRYGGTFPLLRCQLAIQYADGSTETIVTDESWKASSGPIVTSDMLMGETYDARKEMPGWDRNGFADSAWQPAIARDGAKGVLVADSGPPIRRIMELKPRSVNKVKDAYIFDLGQNMVGWARLKVKGDAGTTVKLRFAEMLNPDGSMYTVNYRGAKCTDYYTLKGGGDEVYEPTFTFRGFRYVEITGYPGQPTADAITGVVVYNDTPPTARFECSNPMINQLYANIVWGQRGNFLAVPTDCPQRDERLGWTGDAQIFIRTATYNMDVASFFTKWLVDLEDAQSADGAFPDVAPRVAAGAGTAAWGDAGVICPWTIYLAYGDTRVIERHYDSMVKWVEYCRKHSKDLIRPATGYGDWLSIKANTPKDVLATAYFARSTQLLAKMATVIGKTEDAKKYEDLFQQIKAAFNKAFVAPDGRIKGNTQTCYVLALQFDLLPENLREPAAKHLVEDIKSKANHLSTGFVGVGYLLPTLTAAGQNDVAYTLLNNDTFPSWGYSIKHGATTIWERWDGWTKEKGFQDPGMNSFNHYSLGSVGEWMFANMAGIDLDPARPGYKHIIIRPRLGGGYSFTRAEYDSIHGKIATAWKIENGAISFDVTIPANTTATIHIPKFGQNQISESGKPVGQSEGLKQVRADADATVFEAGSGQYRFVVK